MLAAFLFHRTAHRGSHKNFTAGDLNRAILLLAVSMALEMVQRPPTTISKHFSSFSTVTFPT
jgi:hypothetical protein